jgi:SOS-response transcriptional repressor LexA
MQTTNDRAAPYTRRQGQFLAYIHSYTRLHGRPPSEAEMAAYFRVSPPSVHQMVVTLDRRGLIERTPGQARSLRVLLPPEAIPDLDGGQPPPRREPAFAATYPHVAAWIMGGGWVELGRTDYTRSMARVLDEGGLVWEGEESYAGLEELLSDLDEAIARWTEEK